MNEANTKNYELNTEGNMIPVPVGATVVTTPVQPVMQEAVPIVPAESLVEEAPVEKPYTFRRLSSPDVFPMFKIISLIGVNEFTACFEKDGIKKLIASMTGKNEGENATGNENEEQFDATSVVGISVILEVANVIFGNLSKCESYIYQLLSQTSNLSVEEIKSMDMIVFTEMVIDFIKKEEFKDFIKVVSRLFK